MEEVGPTPSQPRDDFDMDGPVRHRTDRGSIFLAGDFRYVGPNTGGAALIDAVSSLPDFEFPRANGEVRVALPDGAGGWFIGGDFSAVGGLPRARMAHVTNDKRVDTSWNANVDGSVSALQLSSSGVLYLGGQFGSVGGQPRMNLAAVKAVDGTVLSNWQADTDNPVNALALAASGLYVGGEFSTIRGVTVKALAAVNPGDGSLRSNWSADIGGTVSALALNRTGAVLYVGGSFASVGGAKLANLAAVEAATGQVRTSWQPNPDLVVRALAITDRFVYAGGEFIKIGGERRPCIAALDPATGKVSPTWKSEANSTVWSVA